MEAKYLLVILGVAAAACSNDNSSLLGAGGEGGGGGGIGGSGGLNIRLDSSVGGSGGGDAKQSVPGVLTMMVRDFKLYDANDPATNPDFENTPQTDQQGNPTKDYWGPWFDYDIVADNLGADFKPVYKGNGSGASLTTHGASTFDQWFRTVDGTNILREIPLQLTESSNGTYKYDSQANGPLSSGGMFFPIDDGTQYATPFGNQSKSHNYSFTVEIHTLFTYTGGETFDFRGDDDVFVFINKKLVINIGGIHSAEAKSVAIDTLGLTKGETYPLDFFYAERHVEQSNLLITTTLELSTNTEIPIF